MQISQAPSKLVEAFAVNAAPAGGYGGKRTIPVPSQTGTTPGAASYNDGFPPLTMTPLTGGGVVMSGLDMNGILNEATAVDWWMSAGAGFKYDSVFSAAVGGYPAGGRVLNAAGTGYWLSIVDNNVTDPDTGGAGWVPESKRAIAGVYASAQQSIASGANKILWDTVEFDTFGLWDSGNKRFKALWAGVYKLSGYVYMPSPASGQNIITTINKNGSVTKACFLSAQTTDQPLSYPFDAMVSCAVGDYLEAFLNTTSGVLAGVVGSNQAYVYGQVEYMGT